VILIYRIERRTAGRNPDYFVRRTSRRPYLEVIHEPVPPFEGDVGVFEVEYLPRKPLRFIRQVEQPGRL
jgi:hypothetical protein